ncbi:hypothetical protein [Paenibacillus pinihumi]|uniref:hypothetical protein n=1 Tax=Paenibacillus pinihumi TaxID=669462 RepID=UPI00048F29E2|nr:hypothetical protein [Paenibacillus pinihumi]
MNIPDQKRPFKRLPSLLHLRTAAMEERTVLVFQDGELIGSGRIEAIKEITEEDGGNVVDTVITIKGERFMYGACTFAYLR